jgi:hypothetical protein
MPPKAQAEIMIETHAKNLLERMKEKLSRRDSYAKTYEIAQAAYEEACDEYERFIAVIRPEEAKTPAAIAPVTDKPKRTRKSKTPPPVTIEMDELVELRSKVISEAARLVKLDVNVSENIMLALGLEMTDVNHAWTVANCRDALKAMAMMTLPAKEATA